MAWCHVRGSRTIHHAKKSDVGHDTRAMGKKAWTTRSIRTMKVYGWRWNGCTCEERRHVERRCTWKGMETNHGRIWTNTGRTQATTHGCQPHPHDEEEEEEKKGEKAKVDVTSASCEPRRSHTNRTTHPSTMRRVRFVGTGSAVPTRTVTNDELAMRMDTSDEWIATRTGIRERKVVRQGQELVELAVEASKKALESAQVQPEDVELILLATSSPDDLFGSACRLQDELGARQACAFDLTAACSGFVLATITAAQYVRTGAFRNVLVVGADVLSRCVDWNDRGTCILFGDAAGAVLVTDDGSVPNQAMTPSDPGMGSKDARDVPTDGCGLLAFDMRSDGRGNRHLTASYLRPSQEELAKADGTERDRPASYDNVKMNGQDVFKFAVRAVPSTLQASAEKAGIPPDALAEHVDWLVLHQANQRILDAAADRLKFPKERVVSNLARYGNTSAASIPLALDEAVRQGKIRQGDTVAVAGFGAGLTWASAIFRWG